MILVRGAADGDPGKKGQVGREPRRVARARMKGLMETQSRGGAAAWGSSTMCFIGTQVSALPSRRHWTLRLGLTLAAGGRLEVRLLAEQSGDHAPGIVGPATETRHPGGHQPRHRLAPIFARSMPSGTHDGARKRWACWRGRAYAP